MQLQSRIWTNRKSWERRARCTCHNAVASDLTSAIGGIIKTQLRLIDYESVQA